MKRSVRLLQGVQLFRAIFAAAFNTFPFSSISILNKDRLQNSLLPNILHLFFNKSMIVFPQFSACYLLPAINSFTKDLYYKQIFFWWLQKRISWHWSFFLYITYMIWRSSSYSYELSIKLLYHLKFTLNSFGVGNT